ncbi:MAG TPA: LD-carboxypeptidase [Gammaproteobacteria bacterium]|jgi:muramoyltetrapeptide carboxypeptidase|nr:LD-carboxypeptidase [Gammaproteobacteria bacterium]
MKKLPRLNPGDTVDIIAPASRCSDQQLAMMKTLLNSWQLNCLVPDDIFGKDLFCANTDEIRAKHLKNALQNPSSKAIICARGGYGSLRLIPELIDMIPPASPKIFIGMSDTTALQLFLQQHWHWPTIHGASAPDRFSAESITAIQSILFDDKPVEFTDLLPLNQAAKNQLEITASITGGNLSLVQTSMGTTWQIDSRDKIILLEEISERGYRIDRMLEQLRQANIFKHAAAIIFGDFLEGKEPDGSSLIQATLERFAARCEIPVVQITGIGHGQTNFPIPFGMPAQLMLGDKIRLVCER